MAYVERKSGSIVGVYTALQPDYAEEWLDDDSPELVAFYSPAAQVPSEISDRQFFQQMAIEGQISEGEALDAVGSGIIPAAMDALIEQLPASERFAARMLVRGATTFRRDHPVTELIGQLYGMSPQQLDVLWREASQL